jgi:acetyl-CoA carboxylase carboxyl transferase subunit alpha
MPPAVLEFEKPIRELEQKLVQLREFGTSHEIDVSHGVRLLEERIQHLQQDVFEALTPWQRVQLARHPERPLPWDYVQRVFTDFLELHGDRRYADDKAIFGGFASCDGTPVMVIGTRKGRNLEQNVCYNFGSAHPEGYRKALRIMQIAHKARVPIVSLIDTPGAYPGVGAEQRHIAEAIAVNLREMFMFDVPIVVVVVGEGGSGGALGIGVGDRILIFENAYYSVITPEGCAAILWRDPALTPRAAEALRLTSKDLVELGIVDDVIPEPFGGAHRDVDQAAKSLKATLVRHLDALRGVPADALRRSRYEKYRKAGVFREE